MARSPNARLLLVNKKVKMSDLLDYPHDPDQPIAVFDSGVGGLTVVAALRDLLPNEDILYLGDTARVPYGIKSPATVTQFATQLAGWLLQFRPKLMVVACNTLSAVAMPQLESLGLPIIGVVEPGARAAAGLAAARTVAVLATEATVGSGAYVRAIHAIDSSVPVVQRSCPLFVPMAEEGRDSNDKLVVEAAFEYLEPIRRLRPGVVVLGCTHYPLLRDAIAHAVNSGAVVVDSAEETAWAVQRALKRDNRLSSRANAGTLRCYATDNPDRFRKIGTRFCGEPLEYVDLVPLDDIVTMDLQLASP
jgi:glutamate racemase